MLFCAHAIFYFKRMDTGQESFLVRENVYLVDADNDASARELAERNARKCEDRNEDGHLQVNGKRAAYPFAGIRKIVELETHPGLVRVNGLNGLELTYSVHETDTFQEVLDLAADEMLNLPYREEPHCSQIK